MSKEKNIQIGIKKYLLKHPDFFALYPELMSEIEVVSPEGKVANLTTHQLKTLQNENKQLKAQMNQLINNAKQAEALMDRLFNLLTELSVDRESDFIAGFVDFVTTHFSSDYFKLLLSEGLYDAQSISKVVVLNANQLTQFSGFQASQQPLSGRIKQEKIQSVFEGVDDIKSAIVLPIGQRAEFGLMVFASKDEQKFHPNLSSDMLQKLCHILEVFFSKGKPQDEHQAMS